MHSLLCGLKGTSLLHRALVTTLAEQAHDASSAGVQAEPVGGGKLVASGRMWVATEAEFDQRAVRMHAEGGGLPAEAILKRYLPQVPGLWSINMTACHGTRSPRPRSIEFCGVLFCRQRRWRHCCKSVRRVLL